MQLILMSCTRVRQMNDRSSNEWQGLNEGWREGEMAEGL